jgi:hypothetical protein
MFKIEMNNPENLYCPRTGKLLYNKTGAIEKSPALEFCYSHNNNSFVFLSEENLSIYEECKKEAEMNKQSSYELFLEKFIGYSSYILFRIHTGNEAEILDFSINLSYYDPSEEEEDEDYYYDEDAEEE